MPEHTRGYDSVTRRHGLTRTFHGHLRLDRNCRNDYTKIRFRKLEFVNDQRPKLKFQPLVTPVAPPFRSFCTSLLKNIAEVQQILISDDGASLDPILTGTNSSDVSSSVSNECIGQCPMSSVVHHYDLNLH